MAEPTAYGGFWIRFLANLVDSVIFFTLLFLVAVGLAFAGEIGAMLIPLLCVAGPVLYWGLMQASARQATFGKALLGMKVTTASGDRLSLGRSLGRELAKIVSAIPLMIGFLLAAFTGRKQALHDMMASTIVVRENRGHVLIGLVVGVFGWFAPVALVMFIGVGVFAAMMGIGAGMVQQAAQEAQKQPVTQKQPVAQKPAPQAAPAPKAPAAAPVAATVAKLEGFDGKPGTTRAGPAILHLDTMFGANFWLKVYLPRAPEFGGSNPVVTISRIADAKGADLYDPGHQLESDFFRKVSMSALNSPVPHFSGTRNVHVRTGASTSALERVEGTLALEVGTNPVTVSFSAGDVGRTQAVHGNTVTLQSLAEKGADLRFTGEWSRLASITGYGADGKPVPTGMKSGSPNITFQQPATRLEVTFVESRARQEFPFTVTKTSVASAAMAAAPAAPQPKPAVVAEAKPAAKPSTPPAVEAIKVLRVILYQPEDELGPRLGGDAKPVGAYIKALQQPILKAGASLKGSPRSFSVAVVVKPDGASRTWLVPGPGEDREVAALYSGVERELAGVPAPRPAGGPIGFAIAFSVHGGEAKGAEAVIPIPPMWRRMAASEDLKTFDAMVQAVWPDPRPAVAAKEAPAAVAQAEPPPAKAEESVVVPIARGPAVPGPKYNDLMTAVVFSDAAAVSELLAFGKWPDKPDSRGVTPVSAAALLGDVKTAELLLKAGANPAPALTVAKERKDAPMTRLLEQYAR